MTRWFADALPGEPAVLATQTANARSMRLAAKLGFIEVERFEAYGAEQWSGMWSSVTPSDRARARQHGSATRQQAETAERLPKRRRNAVRSRGRNRSGRAPSTGASSPAPIIRVVPAGIGDGLRHPAVALVPGQAACSPP
ncbi:hypothetical protein GCM10010260_73010 [Streptomyces filipinensis]|uniref:Uncharacterized protein n=1 Tax=Streptomyces filipinensis TaxID=66887 RepID=A0A918MFC9_9ACTN|nr:hypothetical protein GCM10010260_73010 [Streptomyces filipinensis]